MPQEDEQSTQAGQRTQETRSFLRQVRAATRRKYTPEEKIRIVLGGGSGGRLPSTICADEKESNLTPTTHGPKSSWKLGRRG